MLSKKGPTKPTKSKKLVLQKDLFEGLFFEH